MKLRTIGAKDEEQPYPQSPFARAFLDSFLSVHRPFFSLSEKLWSPPTDVYETSDSIVVKMEIAGVRTEDLIVTTAKNQLIVRGKRFEDASVHKENYHVMEIHFGQFERIFAFPHEFTLSNITATYEDGFLKVVIPKGRKEKKEIRIDIEDR
jgi:HSP20 family protein